MGALPRMTADSPGKCDPRAAEDRVRKPVQTGPPGKCPGNIDKDVGLWYILQVIDQITSEMERVIK